MILLNIAEIKGYLITTYTARGMYLKDSIEYFDSIHVNNMRLLHYSLSKQCVHDGDDA